MTDALKRLESVLLQAATATPRFPPSSRYASVAVASLKAPGRPAIAYLYRRFVPPPTAFAIVRDHIVEQGDRLDLLAHTELGDAELFWRLCDANGGVRPRELTLVLGRRLRITLPEGVPGAEAVNG
jgi:hypothetical protein